MNLYGAS